METLNRQTKKPKKKKSSAAFMIVIIVCLGVAAFAAYKLISLGLEYKRGRDEYEALQQYAVTTEPEENIFDQIKPETLSGSGDADTDMDGKNYGECPVQVDFASLAEVNRDIVGWLYIGALNISYPIVKGQDNDYYLHRTFQGTEHFSGAIFMDYKNTGDFTDPNTIIYGHNMKDGSMFGYLRHLSEREKYKSDDTFWILTPAQTYRYRIFSMSTVPYDGSVYTLFPEPSEEVVSYIEECASRSDVRLELPAASAESRVVTLSTCTSADTERFVVQGILEQTD